MHNWSTDLSRLKKNPEKFQKYLLEQRINFGLNGHKLSIRQLKKYWHELDIDPAKRRYLQTLIS